MSQCVEVCEGCLAADRKLTKLGKYLDLYHRLSAAIFGQTIAYRVNFKEPLMCWECIRMFHKISKFQQRVTQSHEFLRGIIDCKPNELKSLSSLTTLVKTDYDYKIIHDKEKYTNDVLIKQECRFDDLDQQVAPKEELKELIKDESGISDYETYDTFENNVKEEEIAVNSAPFKNSVKPKTVKIKNEKKQSVKHKYRIIINSDGKLTAMNVCKRVPIDNKELLFWLKKERRLKKYTGMDYKCKECISTFPSDQALSKHNNKYHSRENGKFQCDICRIRLPNKSQMATHCKQHLYIFECLLCGYQCYKNWQIYYHFRLLHKNSAVECLKCQHRFGKLRDFNKHYKDIHNKFICDYCGKKCSTRSIIKQHIMKNHLVHQCKECNLSFNKYRKLDKHVKLKHVKKVTEDSYCVECNKQFDNIHLYKQHVHGSTKHSTRGNRRIPCPECNRVFNRKYVMNDHYNYVHRKQTKYYCEKCSKYFFNGFRLRQHTSLVHDKVRPLKDKLCLHCGRGFSTNRILNNHIRTHTGERPFACPHCSATFAQQTALKYHVKAIHKAGSIDQS